MLKLIDPSLNADVLHALRSMGHGDELVLCDVNFPADSVARHTMLGRLLHIDNVSAARAAKAIRSRPGRQVEAIRSSAMRPALGPDLFKWVATGC